MFIISIMLLFLMLSFLSQDYPLHGIVTPIPTTYFRRNGKTTSRKTGLKYYSYNHSQDKKEYLSKMIQYALNSHHQDTINTADFALKLSGAQITFSLTSQTFHQVPKLLQFIY